MNKKEIAQVCHEVNKAYCESLGDNSQLNWQDAPDWQKSSAQTGVELHLSNPNASPSTTHESWLLQKSNEGWSYGPLKDASKKQHPCYLPFDELPREQQAKDFIFRQVVHSLKRFLTETV